MSCERCETVDVVGGFEAALTGRIGHPLLRRGAVGADAGSSGERARVQNGSQRPPTALNRPALTC